MVSHQIKKVFVIGAGGNGSHLLRVLAQFMAHDEYLKNTQLFIVDGDSYEPRNRKRQLFEHFGNKAQVQAEMLKMYNPQLQVYPIPRFLKKEVADSTIGPEIIGENSLVFVCVDNHQARYLVSLHAQTLQHIAVIFGGNELVSGEAILFRRENGINLDPPIEKFHPDVAMNDEVDQPNCQQALERGETQIIFTNFAVANIMLQLMFAYWTEPNGMLINEVLLSNSHTEDRTTGPKQVSKRREP